jgi:hypothetical protein
MSNDEKVFTMDLRPSWRGLLPALVEVAVNGTTPEGRKIAMEELMRLADFADSVIAEREAEDKR